MITEVSPVEQNIPVSVELKQVTPHAHSRLNTG
jgi:hypothetical protein